MLTIIAYDIRDNRRLLKVAKELENFGVRVQKSVFECHLDDAQLSTVRRILGAIIDQETDHVRYYRICGKDQTKVAVIGNGIISKDYDYFVV